MSSNSGTPINRSSGKPRSIFPRPRLKASGLSAGYSRHGVFDQRHLTVANCLEGLSGSRSHGSRCTNVNKAWMALSVDTSTHRIGLVTASAKMPTCRGMVRSSPPVTSKTSGVRLGSVSA